MSSPAARQPFIALVDRANRALQADMLRRAHERGATEVRASHNAVFGALSRDGDRSVTLAAKAGVTRQSMGEVVRDMVERGLVEMTPDPDDRRAKLVRWTARGLEVAAGGSRYIAELDQRFADELGPDYEAARRVLERVVGLLQDDADPSLVNDGSA